jgi:hypothetical protein
MATANGDIALKMDDTCAVCKGRLSMILKFIQDGEYFICRYCFNEVKYSYFKILTHEGRCQHLPKRIPPCACGHLDVYTDE